MTDAQPTRAAEPVAAPSADAPLVPTQPMPVAATHVAVPQQVTGYPTQPYLPQVPVVKSKSYAAPLSYVGSARRIGAAINRAAGGNVGVAIALWTLGVFAIALAWTFVTAWYLVIFGIFGIFTFPFRLIRRSQRKSMHLQQVALATQQAMLLQQQAGNGAGR